MSALAAKLGAHLSDQTASAADYGFSAAVRLLVPGRTLRRAASDLTKDKKYQLDAALAQAKDVIRDNVRYLSKDYCQLLTTRFTDLLDPVDWEAGDEILKVGSVRTLIRTLIALNISAGPLTLTRTGHLVTTWAKADKTLRVEALPDAKVAWSLVTRAGDRLTTCDHPGDTIANLQAVLQG